MNIELELLSTENAGDVFNFESANRTFFERNLPPRPPGYFERESFDLIMNELLDEQARGECFMHVIRVNGDMAGRMNFFSVREEAGERKAELGFRIAEDFQNQGIASAAAALALDLGYTRYGFTLIEAGTSSDNIGSQRVLGRLGFMPAGREERVMKVNGRWLDGLWYERKK